MSNTFRIDPRGRLRSGGGSTTVGGTELFGPPAPTGPSGVGVPEQTRTPSINVVFDGRSITGAAIINDELIVTYSDGATQNLGMVRGTNGTNGRSISSGEIVDGDLVLTFSDNTVENLGPVVGAAGLDGTDGTNGTNGTNGVDGRSISTAEFVDDELILTFTDNTTLNLGSIMGSDGIDGVDGVDGKTILHGEDDPTGGVGTNGDFYLNITTNRLWGPKGTPTAGWSRSVVLTGSASGPAVVAPLEISVEAGLTTVLDFEDAEVVHITTTGDTGIASLSMPLGRNKFDAIRLYYIADEAVNVDLKFNNLGRGISDPTGTYMFQNHQLSLDLGGWMDFVWDDFFGQWVITRFSPQSSVSRIEGKTVYDLEYTPTDTAKSISLGELDVVVKISEDTSAAENFTFQLFSGNFPGQRVLFDIALDFSELVFSSEDLFVDDQPYDTITFADSGFLLLEWKASESTWIILDRSIATLSNSIE